MNIYVYIYIYACMYTYMYMHVCMNISTYMYIHIYVYVYIYIYIYIYAHTHMYARTYMNISTWRALAPSLSFTHTHTHTAQSAAARRWTGNEAAQTDANPPCAVTTSACSSAICMSSMQTQVERMQVPPHPPLHTHSVYHPAPHLQTTPPQGTTLQHTLPCV